MTKSVSYVIESSVRGQALKRLGGNSPRVNGRLVLKQNQFLMQKQDATYSQWSSATIVSPDFRNRTKNASGYTKIGMGFLDGIKPLSEFPKNQVVNSLKIKLRNKLRETDFNLAVAYAEKTQTADLLKSSAQKLLRAAKAVRRGNLTQAATHLGIPRPAIRKNRHGGYRRSYATRESFSNAWLQYSYGWVPLYNDMYGSMVACDKAIRGLPNRFQRVTEFKGYSKSGTYTTNIRPWPETDIAKCWVDESVSQKFRVAAEVRITNPFAHTVDSLGITNPALVLWEKVPFSFVADWFLPVGSWLQQLPPLLGLDISSVFTTTFSEEFITRKACTVESRSTIFDRPSSPPGLPLQPCTYITRGFISAASRHRVYVERSPDSLTAVTDWPRPKLPNSWEQAVSALSLFTQFMSKHGRL